MTPRTPLVELKRYRAYFNAASAGIFIYAEDGSLLDVNPAACRMHGRTREEILNMHPSEFIAPEAQEVFAAFRETLLRGEPYVGEAVGLRKDGSRFDVAVYGELVEGNDENERLLCGSLVDITERKALEAQLRHAQRLEALGQLAGGVAHDFNNLLLIILGYTELMLEDTEARHRDDLKTVRAAAMRGESLVGRLLAFSRRQALSIRATDLNVAVRDVHALLRHLLSENVVITSEPSESPCVAEVDRTQLEHVLINLAINAQHAMPRGGQLTLRCHAPGSAQAQPTHSMGVEGADALPAPPHGYVCIEVQDAGSGMAPEVMEHAFEPFFTTKGQGEGSGLGLSMVYGTLKQHGGTVELESEIGVGTTFRLFFPASVAASLQEDEAPPPGPQQAKAGETVLVVEDDEDLRPVVQRMLQRLGYEVHCARDGADAHRVADRLDRLDLLITDVVMPGVSGVEVYQQLAATRAALKVLYVSGYAEAVLTDHGVVPEGMRLLPKPFQVDQIASAVRALLDEGTRQISIA